MTAVGQGPSVPQLHALTGLRGIAAWLVVFYHIRFSLTDILPLPAIGWMGKGYLAVDLFFLLSGFVMWLNYGSRLGHFSWSEAKRFWWKRFARIWPLHGFILAAMVAFAITLVVTGRSSDSYPFGELALHAALMQNWGFTGALSWNHPAWSISAEIGAYLVFPFVAAITAWDRLGTPALLAVLAGLGLALHVFFAAQGLDNLGAAIPRTGLARCLAEFAMGAVLGILWQRYRGYRRARAATAACGVSVAGIAYAAGLPETAFVPFLLASVLLAVAFDGSIVAKWLGARPMRWLGDISYATYLVHFFAWILFKLAFVDRDMQLGWLQLAAFLLIVAGLSAALYRWVEKPAQRWIRTAPERLRPDLTVRTAK